MPQKITHLDLFSGIGGFSLAADWVWGKENVKHIFCEIEEFPQKVLRKHWPEAEIHDDITKLDGTKLSGITILTGGFPCQPYSVAGKQRGAEDDRALWPEMLRVIQETRPDWIIGENVGGFVNMGLDDCLSDLEGAGYDCQPMVIPACAVNAPHRRDRVWIVANARHDEPQGRGESSPDHDRRCGEGVKAGGESSPSCCDVADTNTERVQGGENAGGIGGCGQKPWQHFERLCEGIGRNWSVEPNVGRVAHGIPSRVDRLKGLGNAIVPQVAAVIMQAIKEIEDGLM